MQRATQTFNALPASVHEARHFAQQKLGDWRVAAVEWAATQLVSELATNAVLHARTDFEVELCIDGDELLIRISDHSPRAPVRRSFGTDATTGRGLALITHLSRQWGVELGADGKTVWCSLSLSAAAADSSPDAEQLLASFADDVDEPAPQEPDHRLLAA